MQLAAGYLADGGTVGDPNPGNGLLNGGYGVLGQLTWNVTDNLSVAGVYVHDYAPGGRFGFNNNGLGSTPRNTTPAALPAWASAQTDRPPQSGSAIGHQKSAQPQIPALLSALPAVQISERIATRQLAVPHSQRYTQVFVCPASPESPPVSNIDRIAVGFISPTTIPLHPYENPACRRRRSDCRIPHRSTH